MRLSNLTVSELFFQKKEKQHSQYLPHFENESIFWERKYILKMRDHSETHFDNENMFLKSKK
jgi:hypothetical protein